MRCANQLAVRIEERVLLLLLDGPESSTVSSARSDRSGPDSDQQRSGGLRTTSTRSTIRAHALSLSVSRSCHSFRRFRENACVYLHADCRRSVAPRRTVGRDCSQVSPRLIAAASTLLEARAAMSRDESGVLALFVG
jgi:hypothetical protein